MDGLNTLGDWNFIKDQLNRKKATLTDDDLWYTKGKLEELLVRIQSSAGTPGEPVLRIMSEAVGEARSSLRDMIGDGERRAPRTAHRR